MAARNIVKGVVKGIKELQEIIDDTSLKTRSKKPVVPKTKTKSKKTTPPAKQKQGRPRKYTTQEHNEARRAGYKSTGKYFEDKAAGTLKSREVSPASAKRRKTKAADKATRSQYKSTVKEASKLKSRNAQAKILEKETPELYRNIWKNLNFSSPTAFKKSRFKGLDDELESLYERYKVKKPEKIPDKAQEQLTALTLKQRKQAEEAAREEIGRRLGLRTGSPYFKQVIEQRKFSAPKLKGESPEDRLKRVSQIGRLLEETPSQRNLRMSGEVPAGGIRGHIKSLDETVEDPYRIGGQYHRGDHMVASPITRHNIEPNIHAVMDERMGAPIGKQILHHGETRLPSLDIMGPGRRPAQGGYYSETMIRGDKPLSRNIMASRDPQFGVLRPKTQMDFTPTQAKQFNKYLDDTYPKLTPSEKEDITVSMINTGRAKLPEGFTNPVTQNRNIYGTQPPAYERRTPVETAGQLPPRFDEATNQWVTDAPTLGMSGRLPKGLRERRETLVPPASQVSQEAGYIIPKDRAMELENLIDAENIGAAPKMISPRAQKYATESPYPTLPRRATGPDPETIVENIILKRVAARQQMAGEDVAAGETARMAAKAARRETTPTFPPTRPFTPTNVPAGVRGTRQVEGTASPYSEGVDQFIDAPRIRRAQGEVETLGYSQPSMPRLTKKQLTQQRTMDKMEREIIAIRAKGNEFTRKLNETWETPETLAKTADYKKWKKKREALKKKIKKQFPDWQDKRTGDPMINTFKEGSTIRRSNGGQIKKPRGWGKARYK